MGHRRLTNDVHFSLRCSDRICSARQVLCTEVFLSKKVFFHLGADKLNIFTKTCDLSCAVFDKAVLQLRRSTAEFALKTLHIVKLYCFKICAVDTKSLRLFYDKASTYSFC